MTTRLTFMIVVAVATSLLACAQKPRRELDCRERIDDCMAECSQDYKRQDGCYAGCRTLSCEDTKNEAK